MKTQPTVMIATCLVLISFLSSCTPSSKTDPMIHNMSVLETDIKEIIGSASCTANHQCHTIGFGDKPCGGFSSHLVYSYQNTDVDKLKSRVAQYNKLSETWNRENNISSTCDVIMPPALTCLHQACQPKEKFL